MNIIAHRGFSGLYPENTLLAFEKALEASVDGIETDVRLTLDGILVISHDSFLDHIGHPKLSIETTDHKDLPKSIPTLKEVLHLINGRCTLILEIKQHNMTQKIIARILEPFIKDRLAWIEVSSFDDDILFRSQKLNSKIRLHKLIDDATILQRGDFDAYYATMYAFDICIELKDHPKVTQLFNRGKKVIFWTVKNEDLRDYSRLYGAMSNDPIALRTLIDD